ncbi:phage head closure protein [Emcibacter sp.]|uniref:phage head closure protein n=1 Tax=Emcibacter sp. TaxID=1979954 RepID=UPI003A8ED2FC
MSYRKLRHRITFQKAEETGDGTGGVTTVWRDVACVWAAVRPVAARREVQARKLVRKPVLDIRVRFLAELEGCDRLRHGVGHYRVLTVQDPDGDGRWLDFRVEQTDD